MLPAFARVPALRLSLFMASRGPMPSFRRPSPQLRQMLASLVLATFAGLYLIAGLSIASVPGGSGLLGTGPATVIADPKAPPQPEPLQFREVAPEDAVQINAAIPLSDLPNPAARAFRPAFMSPTDQLRSVDCLTAAIYYEAATEPVDGQRAVAQVVLNRLRHPAFPKTVCGVVFQGSERATGCQFTFTCDGALRRTPMAAYWQRAHKIAEEALAGKVYAPVGHATHYHTNWVVPYWSSSLVKVAIVGTHIFYRWAGGWGRPAAFSGRYAGGEPDVSHLGRRSGDPLLATTDPVDAAAAAAAAAAEAAKNPNIALPGGASVDSFNRAVLRRYEPLSREAAAATAIARTGEPASQSLRWSLGSSDAPSTATPLGRKPDPAAAPGTKPAAAAPAAPPCLQGVRKLGEKVSGPTDPTRC
jgi:spore germination cell wall hydrolase CwlJ-like protein